MSTIIARNGLFLCRVRKHGFKPVAKTFNRKTDATAWGRRVEADMQAGRWEEALRAVPTLKEAITEYRLKVASKQKGGVICRYWFDELEASHIGSQRVNELSPFDLSAWRDEQAGRLKPGTVARKMGLLSGVFTWCLKERGWIKVNPLHAVRKPTVSDSRARTLSGDELDYLQRAAAGSRAAWLADVLVVLCRSAMRRGEVWGLQRGDVDYAQSTAHLADTKNGSSRDVPLCPDARDALHRLEASATTRGSTALVPVADAHAVSTCFRRALARARQAYLSNCTTEGKAPSPDFLDDVRLHDLRHHAVSAWANTGSLSMLELMAVSGHKTPRMLARYAHLNASKLADKMATLNA